MNFARRRLLRALCLPFLVRRGYRNRNLLRLSERGFWDDFFPREDVEGLTNLLVGQPQTVYLGIDPTADSLHVGHLPLLMAAFQAQTAGHHVIFVLGGATARIGDPSGRSQERPVLKEEVVQRNVESLKRSLEKIFQNHENDVWRKDQKTPLEPIRVLNNQDWYSGMNWLDFINSHGHKFFMGELLSRSSVKSRLGGDGVLSLSEFSYQAFQAFDWLHLFQKYDCRVQLGGKDQFGNLMTGHDFVKRLTGKTVYGITWPLSVDREGHKLGKSTGTAQVWLDERKTSPLHLHQHFLNVPDDQVQKDLERLTFLPLKDVQAIMAVHKGTPGKQKAQRALADRLVTLIHGRRGLELCGKLKRALYDNCLDSLLELSAEELSVALKDAKQVQLLLSPGMSVLEAVLQANALTWERDAREVIQAGGLSVNLVPVRNPSAVLVIGEHILPSNVTLLRVGRNEYTLIKWLT